MNLCLGALATAEALPLAVALAHPLALALPLAIGPVCHVETGSLRGK